MRRPSPAAVVLAAGAAALVGAGAHAGISRSSTEAQRASNPPLTVSSVLPAWRAPGVGVPVSGFAGAQERVVLRASGIAVDSAASGPRGRYRLRFSTTKPGLYRLTVSAHGATHWVGTLRVRPVTLDAVGDITFGEQVGPAIAANGARYPWLYVAPTLRAADITTGNLETAVSTRGVAAAKKYAFRGPPDALSPLHPYAGFDVLTLANNHAVDYGRDALADTVAHVRAAGIAPIGAGADIAHARRPAIVERGGLRVAFLGYSDVNPLGFTATSTAAGTAPADLDAIRSDVQAARRRADVVVCFFHWGTELHPEPDSRQEMFADACLSSGAKVVLGAHPHVLGRLSTPRPRTVVAWTLGNFVFPSGAATARTAILHVDLDARGVRGQRLLPVRIVGFRPQLDRD